MNKELPVSIQQVNFDNPIWGLLYDEEDNLLLVDSRNESNKKIEVWKLELASLARKATSIQIDWWEKLIGVKQNQIYSIQYEDQHDPSNYRFRCFDLDNQSVEILKNQPEIAHNAVEPFLYEMESDHHKTVSQFLSLELTTSCEYMEFDDYIIISYYLRSEKGFDRFLLLLKAGQKLWRVKQDGNMKGFASGSFFVVRNTLIFVRERNEVCIYTF